MHFKLSLKIFFALLAISIPIVLGFIYKVTPSNCATVLTDPEYRKLHALEKDKGGINVAGILCTRSKDYEVKECGSVIRINRRGISDTEYYFVNKSDWKIIGKCGFWEGPCQLPKNWTCGSFKME